MSFFNVTANDLAAAEKPIWPAKEVAEFVITDFKESEEQGFILNTKVLSERHNDRSYTHFISNRDHEIAQKQRVQFLLAFWTKDELQNGTAKPVKLVNRRFSAVAGQAKEHNGQTYQQFSGWKDLGEYAPTAGASAMDSEGNPKY